MEQVDDEFESVDDFVLGCSGVVRMLVAMVCPEHGYSFQREFLPGLTDRASAMSIITDVFMNQ